MKVRLIISSGQYETAAVVKTITATTPAGFCRRVRQLRREHATYGDNWAGWIPARIAIACQCSDIWQDNQITGGQSCQPARGWLVDDVTDFGQADLEETARKLFE